MTGLAIFAAGLAAIFAVYSALRTEWPSSYHTLDNASSADFSMSAGPLRYLLFRFGPLALISIFMTVTSERLGATPSWLWAVAAVLTHTCLSNGKAARKVLQRPAGSRRGPLILTQLVVGIGCVAISAVSTFLAPQFSRIVPEVDALVSDLWTAVFAAVAAVAFTRATSSDDDSFEVALNRSYGRIDRDLFAYAIEKAASNGTEPKIVLTLMVVENLQRPRWFRWLEHRFGRVLPVRTTGLLQVMSETPLSDHESIDRVIEGKLQNVQIPDGYAGATEAFMIHNPSRSYGELCDQALSILEDRFDSDFARELHHAQMGEDS